MYRLGRLITVGGEVREWYEGFRNANWGLGTQDDNGYLLQLSAMASIGLIGVLLMAFLDPSAFIRTNPWTSRWLAEFANCQRTASAI